MLHDHESPLPGASARSKSRQPLAFTLIELLIVVAIIGILAAIAIPNFNNAKRRAQLAQIQGNMDALSKALQAYRAEQTVMPPHDSSHLRNQPWLTTPIPYITAIPWDIFQQVQGRDKPRLFSSPSGKLPPPELHPEPFFVGGWGMPTDRAEVDLTPRFYADRVQYGMAKRAYKVGRYLVSVGPNNVHDPDFVYDVSNGLRSPGDIVKIVP